MKVSCTTKLIAQHNRKMPRNRTLTGRRERIRNRSLMRNVRERPQEDRSNVIQNHQDDVHFYEHADADLLPASSEPSKTSKTEFEAIFIKEEYLSEEDAENESEWLAVLHDVDADSDDPKQEAALLKSDLEGSDNGPEKNITSEQQHNLFDIADSDQIKVPETSIDDSKKEENGITDIKPFSELLVKPGTLKEQKKNHSDELPFPCKVCGKCFTLPCYLKKHMRIHSQDRPFSCDICGKSFTISRYLKNHKKVHSDDSPFACEICGKTFTISSRLSNHKRIHSNERPFVCEICKKSFISSHDLITHIRIHSGEKPFACEVCRKSFSTSSYLLQHKRIHSGERPFACDICKKTFTMYSSLSNHKKIHSGERPFTCEECGKSFILPHDLKNHKRTHSGEKPFSCEICGKSFARSSNLNSHKKIHSV